MERAEPAIALRGGCAVHHYPALELREKVPRIVGGVGVPEHVEVEQHEPLAREQKLPGAQVAVHRRGVRRIEVAHRLHELRPQRRDQLRRLGAARQRLLDEPLGGRGRLGRPVEAMQLRDHARGAAQ